MTSVKLPPGGLSRACRKESLHHYICQVIQSLLRARTHFQDLWQKLARSSSKWRLLAIVASKSDISGSAVRESPAVAETNILVKTTRTINYLTNWSQPDRIQADPPGRPLFLTFIIPRSVQKAATCWKTWQFFATDLGSVFSLEGDLESPDKYNDGANSSDARLQSACGSINRVISLIEMHPSVRCCVEIWCYEDGSILCIGAPFLESGYGPFIVSIRTCVNLGDTMNSCGSPSRASPSQIWQMRGLRLKLVLGQPGLAGGLFADASVDLVFIYGMP